jgi:phosphinothricin acetyltransferase
MMPEIIEMEKKYLGEALEVYQWYVLNSTATFQISPADPVQMEGILFFENPRYRSFAIREAGVFIGYGIITRWKTREAFDNSAEITIYLAHTATGKGYGRQIVQHLEDFARSQNIHALIAQISGENTASCKLFERSGYIECSRYREVGFKFGRILDLVCYEKIL